MEKLLTRGIVVLFLVPAVFFTWHLIQAQETGKVELTSFSGDVQVFLKGEENEVEPQEGMELEAGDKIETGSGGAAELSFNQANTNLVRLSEDSSVEVSLSGDEKLKMTEGEVFASISSLPSGSAFEITTPTAVSGARGTDWVTKITDEGTDVEAVEKEPYVRHYESPGKLSSQPVFITPGQMTTVKRFQKPMAFRPMQENRKQQWQALKQDVRQRGGEALQKRNQRPPFDRNKFIGDMRERKGAQGLKPLRSGDQPGSDSLQPGDGGKRGEFNAREERGNHSMPGEGERLPPRLNDGDKRNDELNPQGEIGSRSIRGGGDRLPSRLNDGGKRNDELNPQGEVGGYSMRREGDRLPPRLNNEGKRNGELNPRKEVAREADDKSRFSRPVFEQKKPEQSFQSPQGVPEKLGNKRPLQGNQQQRPKLNLQQRRPPMGARPKR